jgi:dipeptidyl aminopeptidase/acylaminoacyl peptidase
VNPLVPTPTVAAEFIERKPLSLETPPAGFDPSTSALTFQFPLDPNLKNLKEKTAQVPAELIADGYHLGRISFGLPWGLRCVRSPDGKRLAFSAVTDGTTIPDATLRWFNLNEPERVYEPLPGLQTTEFAFAPDNRHLAVFANGQDKLPSGLYLVDIGTGEHTLLLPLASGRSLVWSPDGEYLALVGRGSFQEEESAYVLLLQTRQVLNQVPLQFLDEQSAPDWPISSWGVTFPAEMGGMEACTRAP